MCIILYVYTYIAILVVFYRISVVHIPSDCIIHDLFLEMLQTVGFVQHSSQNRSVLYIFEPETKKLHLRRVYMYIMKAQTSSLEFTRFKYMYTEEEAGKWCALLSKAGKWYGALMVCEARK